MITNAGPSLSELPKSEVVNGTISGSVNIESESGYITVRHEFCFTLGKSEASGSVTRESNKL